MFFLAKVGPEIYAVLFPLLCVFIPVVLLAIFVVVKKIVKNAKRASKMKANTGVDYEAYFGGHDNIVNIEIKMSRVNVTVKDVDKVVEGFAHPDNLLYGPEIKFYSNEVVLDKNFMTSIKGLYSIGDGGGLTTGLMMASCAGVQLARNITKE